MSKTVYVCCPFCKGTMEVKSESGEVIQKWEAGKEESSADKMASALKKIQEGKKRRENLFDQKKQELEGHRQDVENIFKDEVERVKKEGVKENPFKPFDLD